MPKSRRGHPSVPLAARVARTLAVHRERSRFSAPDDLVFCHPLLGRPLERSRLFKRFKTVAVAAGFPALRFDDLRHTFGTRMAAAGGPAADAAGVDGPPRLQDDLDLCELSAARRRGGTCRPGARVVTRP